MVWKNGHLLHDAARNNQLDRRQNGVIDYDPARHPKAEGPLAVYEGNSTTSVELRVRGGSATVGGTRVEHEPGPIGLEDGPSGDRWRVVLVYVAEDGSIQTQPGTPGDNEMRIIPEDPETTPITTGDGEVVNVLTEAAIEEISPEGPAAVVPEAYPAAGLNGTILAAVWVPPGATTSSDVPLQYIQDRRRPALQAPSEGWETPAHVTVFNTFDAGQARTWPMNVRGGESLQFWGYSASQLSSGTVTLSNYDFAFELVDLEAMGSYSDTGGVIWSASSAPQGNPEDGPIETFDVPKSESHHGYIFRMRNDGTETFTALENRIALQLHYTIVPTDRY